MALVILVFKFGRKQYNTYYTQIVLMLEKYCIKIIINDHRTL